MAGLAKPIKKQQSKQMIDHAPGQKHKCPNYSYKRIVLSSHRVSEKALKLNKVTFGLIVASNAFGMRMAKAMSVTLAELENGSELGVLDKFCLHPVNHRELLKKLADICFKPIVENGHKVNNAMKKPV